MEKVNIMYALLPNFNDDTYDCTMKECRYSNIEYLHTTLFWTRKEAQEGKKQNPHSIKNIVPLISEENVVGNWTLLEDSKPYKKFWLCMDEFNPLNNGRRIGYAFLFKSREDARKYRKYLVEASKYNKHLISISAPKSFYAQGEYCESKTKEYSI
ncbi:MAG: hypothetical protein AABY32_04160 [Nanoarchaeota archaeon]